MKKILIVEDELIVRSIYRRKFEMSGYQVETAEEGATALSVLPVFKPDVIQVDIMLPGMDGVEVIRKIRTWPDYKTIPILVISSFYRPDLAKEAWKAGATKCVSKMDCTPNLALELVEQMLSGESAGGGPSLNMVSKPKETFRVLPPETPWEEATQIISRKSAPASGAPASNKPDAGGTKFTTRPRFSQKSAKPGPTSGPTSGPAPADESPWNESKKAPEGDAAFRIEVRDEFLKRAPQIQTELRDRVGALLKSNSPTDQIALLRDLETSVSSLASLSGITGYSRISHISGAMDALIKDLHKKPAQMTSSVLRTIAHASDCLNMLFRDLEHTPRDVPQSTLILAVDDEPIARRTISVALAKASLRCIGMEDPRAALTVLRENAFDLVFLDVEMPALNGFELCAELRKLPTNKATPVIFVTSLTKFEVRAQSSLAGANDLIAKPFLMMELAVKALTYLLKPQSTVDPQAAAK